MAELHVHGGQAVIAATLDALSQIDGNAAAQPGDFTRRLALKLRGGTRDPGEKHTVSFRKSLSNNAFAKKGFQNCSAFINGKLTVHGVENLASLITAKSRAQLALANAQATSGYEKRLDKLIERWMNRLSVIKLIQKLFFFF